MGTGSERSEVPVPFFDGAAALRPGKGTDTVAATRFPRGSVRLRDGASPLSRAPLYSTSNYITRWGKGSGAPAGDCSPLPTNLRSVPEEGLGMRGRGGELDTCLAAVYLNIAG